MHLSACGELRCRSEAQQEESTMAAQSVFSREPRPEQASAQRHCSSTEATQSPRKRGTEYLAFLSAIHQLHSEKQESSLQQRVQKQSCSFGHLQSSRSPQSQKPRERQHSEQEDKRRPSTPRYRIFFRNNQEERPQEAQRHDNREWTEHKSNRPHKELPQIIHENAWRILPAIRAAEPGEQQEVCDLLTTTFELIEQAYSSLIRF